MDVELLHSLEKKIDSLLTLCNELHEENVALKANQSNWQEERVKLREKNELARSRVDSMISRLRSLEQDS